MPGGRLPYSSDFRVLFDSSTMALPVYAAICCKPQSKQELRRTLTAGPTPIARAVKILKDHNVIVERKDGKLQAITVLVAAKIPKAGQPWPQPSTVEVGSPAPLRRPDPEDDTVRIHAMPNLKSTPMPVSISAGERAKALAAKLKLPAARAEGELSAGQLGRCGCGAATPFRYGSVITCPACARK